MKKVISTEQLPIKMWLDALENEAIKQAQNLANLPFAFRHIALMPDCHSGYGMPIGGVLATKGVIVPGAVGVDIGCGMLAIRTELNGPESGILEDLVNLIREKIPVGFSWHESPCDVTEMPSFNFDSWGKSICWKEWENAKHQLGTLGGGNHFIELQSDDDGFVWIMIHSGSRNLGKKVADYYCKLASQENEKWFSSVPTEWQLSFFPFDSEFGRDYLEEMKYCVDFAKFNRSKMLRLIKDSFRELLKFGDVDYSEELDVAHNYARWENHFNKNVIVHRKGATRAYKDELGIIPGSQGTCSYIVKGLGNRESFMSCSHGAGRIMGRKQARRELNLDQEIASLDKNGIIHSIKTVDDLDEAPSAYKNINEVMDNQSDLVEIVYKLTPLAVIKG